MITQAGSSAAFLYRKEKVIDKRCRTSNKQTGSYGGKDEKEQNQTNWEMVRFSSACTRSHHFCIFCSCLCAGSGSCNFTGSPCLEVSTMFLSKHQNQNIQISAYLSHFFYAKNYFNFFVFMI